MLSGKEYSKVSTGAAKDAYYSFAGHFSARVMRVANLEWRADKLIMPEIPIQQNELPPDENDQNYLRAEDEKVWKDLSVNEMINLSTLTLSERENSEQNDENIHGFFLDNRFFNQGGSII
ncbi:hypothetical protein SteCoe_37806 [Stentor coeruleus]|uniref:Anaphase-promoting complex subunit 13 n=1 Tax=Stentor coeruleus TaxID=5963 RepID=A0A1R2AME0_9CILI|nr:hypothetical protein SteCoe_37806 [Stentor coeruleus]